MLFWVKVNVFFETAKIYSLVVYCLPLLVFLPDETLPLLSMLLLLGVVVGASASDLFDFNASFFIFLAHALISEADIPPPVNIVIALLVFTNICKAMIASFSSSLKGVPLATLSYKYSTPPKLSITFNVLVVNTANGGIYDNQ